MCICKKFRKAFKFTQKKALNLKLKLKHALLPRDYKFMRTVSEIKRPFILYKLIQIAGRF